MPLPVAQVKVRATALDLLLRVLRVPFVGIHHVFLTLWASLLPTSSGAPAPSPLHLAHCLLLLCKLVTVCGVTLTKVGDLDGPGAPTLDAVPLTDVLTLAVSGLEHRDKAIRKAALNVRSGGGGGL